MALWVRLRRLWHNVLHRSELEQNMADEVPPTLFMPHA